MMVNQTETPDVFGKESLLRETGNLYDGIAEAVDPSHCIICIGGEQDGEEGIHRSGLMLSGGEQELRKLMFFLLEDNEEFFDIVMDAVLAHMKAKTEAGKKASTGIAMFHLERLQAMVDKANGETSEKKERKQRVKFELEPENGADDAEMKPASAEASDALWNALMKVQTEERNNPQA